MDFTQHLSVSYYKNIAVIDESHKIYLAQHQESHKVFVKKILDVYNADIYEYLYLHPIAGTPKILALCEEDQQLTVVEEYISGTSLADRIHSHCLSTADIVRYMIDLCDILEALHQAYPPIIHRDIKPSNIMIDCWNHAVLLDFNAAKFFSPGHTADTVLLGTMGYAAPEQYGFGASSPQTDIYSLGILLREMKHSLLAPCAAFDAAIETCTKLKAAERYSSVGELKKYMESISAPRHLLGLPTFLKGYVLPGYRSHTPWKMLLATVYYLLTLWLCAGFQVKGLHGFRLLFYKIFTLLASLSWVFSGFNYRNIQNLMPLCHDRSPFLRALGILILTLVIILFSFLILCISQELFTS